MSKGKNEDRELQIELTKLQIKHEHDISIYTVFLSVFVSMMLSVLSVYIPLGQVTNNLLYWWFAAIFNLVVIIPIYRLMKGLAGGERQLSKDIQDLKDRFLSKQAPTEVKENQTPENKTQRGNWKVWFKKAENVALILSLIFSIVALLFTGLSTYREWYPPATRARLTIFIDTYDMRYGMADELEFDVSGRVVNDSPLTASIKRWDYTVVTTNMTQTILRGKFYMTNMTLSPSEETSFTMGKTLVGENNTRIPQNAVRGCSVWFQYEDEIGIQVATKEFSFLP